MCKLQINNNTSKIGDIILSIVLVLWFVVMGFGCHKVCEDIRNRTEPTNIFQR